MMRLITLSIFIIVTGLLLSQQANAQERNHERVWVSPSAVAGQTIGLTKVEVTYGRPGVRERVLFASDGLAPFGEVWRTGANESTVITFSDDVFVEGELVEEGVYSLYTIPGEDEWTIIINDKLSWGTEYDAAEDRLRVQVTPEEAHFVEQMMIYFEDVTPESGTLYIHWGNIRVPVELSPDRELE
tara:strand:+ start:5457 stop:6014 length:558 start_codon:yes stop_codon:yes gene_type:complete